MFEETVLRFADKDRQRELAEREQELAARQASLLARQQNLAFRQGLMAKHPQAVLDAIQTEDTQRAINKEHDQKAKELKSRFGLQDHELLDTPAMRLALEAALAEKEVEQTQRAERIADRASLLAGLDKLALIDSQKVSDILQATKQINPPREWSRAETAQMFANAMSWKTPSGATKTYPKTLDGWATSLQERTRALELAEIKLDAQEQVLRAQVQRTVNERAQAAAKSAEQVTPAAEASAEKSAVPTTSRTAEVAAGAAVAAGVSAQSASPGSDSKRKPPMDLTYERLKDPKRFGEAVVEYVGRTNSTFAVAEMAVGAVRDRLERQAQRERQHEAATDKAEIDRARDEFLSKGASTNGVAATRDGRGDIGQEQSNVVAIDSAKRAPDVAVASSQSSATDGVTGFKALGRNKTKDAAGRGTSAAGKEAVEGKEQAPAAAAKTAGAERGQRKKFSELNAHEKIERRAEFFGDLREAAGFTRDGKQAVSEKAKEATRPGKQHEGHGL